MNLDSQVKQFQENDLLEANIRMIGDATTIADIVKLIAYIRHAIQNKEQATITVDIGKNVNSDFFGFQVNQSEIRDYLTQSQVSIN